MFQKTSKPDLFACPTADGAIVLDLSTETYYALHRHEVHQSMDNAFFRDHGIALLGDLVDIENLSPVEAARNSLSASIPCLLALLRAAVYVTAVQRLFGTTAVINHLRRLKQRKQIFPTVADSSHRLPSATYAFRLFRPFLYTARDHCLFDSLVLAEYLLRLGCDATFVIAVRTQPFQAHAWTQSGHHLVDDCAEKVQLFSPILVA